MGLFSNTPGWLASAHNCWLLLLMPGLRGSRRPHGIKARLLVVAERGIEGFNFGRMVCIAPTIACSLVSTVSSRSTGVRGTCDGQDDCSWLAVSRDACLRSANASCCCRPLGCTT